MGILEINLRDKSVAHHISKTNYSADPKKMGFTYGHYFQNPNDNTTFSHFDIKYDDIQFEWKTGNKASFILDDKKGKDKIR